MSTGRIARGWGPPVVLLATALAFPSLAGSNYVISIGALALTFVVMGQALNLVYGYAGYLSIATTVFWAVGAYTSARLVMTYDWHPLAAMAGAGLVAGLVGIGVGLVSMRQGPNAFAILTLIFALFAALLASTWDSMTNGTQGIAGLPVVRVGPSSWGIELRDERDFYWAMLIFAIVLLGLGYLAVSSRWGRVLRATATDEVLAESFGIHLLRERVRVLAIGAVFCGLIGGLHAFRITVVDPGLLSLVFLAPLLGGLFLGGPGNYWGNVVATALLVVLPQASRDFGAARNLIYGAALVVLAIAVPQGIGERLGNFAVKFRRADPRGSVETDETWTVAEPAHGPG